MRPSVASKRRCPRKTAASAVLAAALAVFSTQAIAADNSANPREAITVDGNRRIDAETVRSYFHASADGRFDEAARDAALKSLIATGLFDKVSIEHAGERLVVHLHEAPVLGRVAFEGNKRIKESELSAVIESRLRGTLQRAVVQADVGRIMEAYRHAGRDDVGVRPEIIDRGNDRVDLVYEITEGAKTPVRQIDFVGNRAFGKRQLAAVIKTSATNMLSFIIGGDVYDPDLVASDREQLRTYYRSKGYADASVPAALAEYDPATHGFTLTFTIDEGLLYQFGDINLAACCSSNPAGHSTAPRSKRPSKRSPPNLPSSAIPSPTCSPAPHATQPQNASMWHSRSTRERGPMPNESTFMATPAPASM
jgi:outer membrane protein insertion porin family